MEFTFQTPGINTAKQTQRSIVSGAPSMKSDNSKQTPPGMSERRSSGYAPSAYSSSVSSGSVLCDVCSGSAVKRCLTCMASYCEIHVKDHHTSPDLDSHELQDLFHHSLCPQHHKRLKFYCLTDQSAICSRCFLQNHTGHDIIEQASERRPSKSMLREGSADVPPPGPIQFVSVGPDSVSLRWSPPEGAPGHRIFKVTWIGGKKHRSFPVTGKTLEVTELTPGEKYRFTVATLSQDGRQSTPVEGAVYTVVPPPRILQLEVRSLGADLTWMKPFGVDQVTYLLEIIKDEEDIRTIQRDSCQYTITGLQAAADYTINVTTVVGNGCQSKPASQFFRPGPPLRVVLIGGTGVGKSRSGNTILDLSKQFGYKPESARHERKFLTNECDQVTTSSPRKMQVIDTPPILDTFRDETTIENDILDCIRLSRPGPHAFLLVIKLGCFTKEEQNAVRALQEIFGEKVKDHIIVLFTHGDQLDGQAIEEYVSSGPKELQELVRSCGGRFHVFDNTKEREGSPQVAQLVKKIDEMVAANGGEHFTEEMYEETTKVLEKGNVRDTKLKDNLTFLPLLQKRVDEFHKTLSQ